MSPAERAYAKELNDDFEARLTESLKEDLEIYQKDWTEFVLADGLEESKRYYRNTLLQLIAMDVVDLPTKYPDGSKIELEDVPEEVLYRFNIQDLANEVTELILG